MEAVEVSTVIDDFVPPATQVELPPDRFLDREISWLAFNNRVLDLAKDAKGSAAGTGEIPGHLLLQP
jgi:polyphosphate kinase